MCLDICHHLWQQPLMLMIMIDRHLSSQTNRQQQIAFVIMATSPISQSNKPVTGPGWSTIHKRLSMLVCKWHESSTVPQKVHLYPIRALLICITRRVLLAKKLESTRLEPQTWCLAQLLHNHLLRKIESAFYLGHNTNNSWNLAWRSDLALFKLSSSSIKQQQKISCIFLNMLIIIC